MSLLRRFVQEAQIGGQLQHPGIAPVYDIGRLPDGRPFIAMKLVRGKTFEAMLRGRQDLHADPTKYLGIFEQVCQAMAFAHSHGVIHRDLKPANVMIGEFGEIQVMDWGLARLLTDEPPSPVESDMAIESLPNSNAATITVGVDTGETRVGQVMGTPAYMPPEQALGRTDKTTDVFALGAIRMPLPREMKSVRGIEWPRMITDSHGASHAHSVQIRVPPWRKKQKSVVDPL